MTEKADKPKFKSRNDEVMTHEEWTACRRIPEYATVRTFRNDKVHLRLEWTGTPSTYDAPFEYWDIYVVTVENWLIDGAELEGGRWVTDPSSRTFWSVREAERFMEAFLAKYTDCEHVENEDGTLSFTEVGNLDAPPDPNKPSGADDNAFIGSW